MSKKMKQKTKRNEFCVLVRSHDDCSIIMKYLTNETQSRFHGAYELLEDNVFSDGSIILVVSTEAEKLENCNYLEYVEVAQMNLNDENELDGFYFLNFLYHDDHDYDIFDGSIDGSHFGEFNSELLDEYFHNMRFNSSCFI